MDWGDSLTQTSEADVSAGDSVTLFGFRVETQEGAGCVLVSNRAGEPALYQQVEWDGSDFTVAIPDAVTISGTIDVPPGQVPRYADGLVVAYSLSGEEAAIVHPDNTGHYELRVLPGSYDLQFTTYLGESGYQATWTPDVTVTDDTVVNSSLPTVPVTINLVQDGPPTEHQMYLSCSRSEDETPPRSNRQETISTYATVTSQVTMPGKPAADGWSCWIEQAEPYAAVEFRPRATDNVWTLDLDTWLILEGSPSGSVDEDGVDDLVESRQPNRGDGNRDGIPDYRQDNVTSLPSMGDTPDSPYLTVEGPAGTKLTQVSTSDPADAAVPPPPGTTLPTGLVSFSLTGVPVGSDQKVRLFPYTTEGVNGYAKYDPGTGVWSALPASRVHVEEYDYVEITLTDGGIGDADGVANGVIKDPGGIAVIQTGDVSPPVVTGRATTRPNSAGWYRGNVRIDWSATDPSGVKRQPADTIVSTEGANVTAQSPEVCDKKTPTPNCGRGTLTGLKIDKTAPSLAVQGVSNGATYTLGSVPTPSCMASDALSGLAAQCKGTRSGGNANGVGQFSYVASVTDKAGNARVVTVGYRVVYGFAGFLAPLNDPGPPISVFKAGSTVAVAFAGAAPNSRVPKPMWVSPARGGRTTLPVNEAVSTAKGTSGSSFVWKNGRWQFDWSTKGVSAGYLYRIGVRLDDGTTHYLTIGVR